MFSLYLQNANGPAAEAMLSFSDSVMLLVVPIAFGVFLFIISLLPLTHLHRFSVDNQALEFVWTSLPALALLVLAAPSLSLLYLLDEVGMPSTTTKVIGHQWYWEYEAADLTPYSVESYSLSSPLRLLGTDASIYLDCKIVLRLLITAADVLHSWTIPAMGIKADAVPGRLNQLSTFLERTGVFYGQCSEICGSNHSFMPINAEVLS